MKLYSIQYLRALAVVMVLTTHAILHPLGELNTPLMRLGSLGVVLFFVISGFIMVAISGEGTFAAAGFYIRRIKRIVPLYWLATLFVALVSIIAPTVLRNSEFDFRRLILSLLFIPHARPNGETVPLLKLGWSLNYEMLFYLGFGALGAVSALWRVWLLSFVLVALTAIGLFVRFDNVILEFYTGEAMLVFAFGMWAGYARLRGRFGAGSPVLQGIACALTALCWLLSFVIQPGSHITPAVTLLQGLGSAALLVAAVDREARLPVLRGVTLLGDASYSIYLIHMYAIGAAAFLFIRLFAAPLWLVVLVGFVGGALAGIVTHFLVERPIMQWMKRPVRARSASSNAPALPPDGISPAVMQEGDGR